MLRRTPPLLLAGLIITACSSNNVKNLGPVCGDGTIDPDEQCDSDDLAQQTCESLGLGAGTLVCHDCVFDTSGCGDPICGDGLVVGYEECDGAALNGATCGSLGLVASGSLSCRSDCRFAITNCLQCGDGVCHPGETASICPQDCGVLDIAAGTTHTCAVLADHSIWCWGAREGHRMGGTGDVNFPVRLPDIEGASRGATSIAAGESHTCYLRPPADVSDNNVYCWGRNGFGEIGVTPSAEVFPPHRVAGLTPVEAIAAGGQHTCAIAIDEGSIYCWGRGDYGAIGNGAFGLRNPQVSIARNGGQALALGKRHSCAMAGAAKNPYCWGSNERGQLAHSDIRWREAPEYLSNSQLDSMGGGAEHTCASVDTTMVCWGNNSDGQLGAAPSPDQTGFGMNLLSGRGAQVTVGGEDYTCAIPSVPGPVNCWGNNQLGQLGDGTLDPRHDSGSVLGITNAVDLAGGAYHVCAVLADQTARCWGSNSHGQLGDRTTVPYRVAPAAPNGLN